MIKKPGEKQTSLFIIFDEKKSVDKRSSLFIDDDKKSSNKWSSLFIIGYEKSPVRNNLAYL